MLLRALLAIWAVCLAAAVADDKGQDVMTFIQESMPRSNTSCMQFKPTWI